MSQNDEIKVLADQLFDYMKPRIEDMLSNSVSFYRAEVMENLGNGTLSIQRPFDETIVTLPCVPSIANASVGTQVTVLVFGSSSNAKIVGDTTLSNW